MAEYDVADTVNNGIYDIRVTPRDRARTENPVVDLDIHAYGNHVGGTALAADKVQELIDALVDALDLLEKPDPTFVATVSVTARDETEAKWKLEGKGLKVRHVVAHDSLFEPTTHTVEPEPFPAGTLVRVCNSPDSYLGDLVKKDDGRWYRISPTDGRVYRSAHSDHSIREKRELHGWTIEEDPFDDAFDRFIIKLDGRFEWVRRNVIDTNKYSADRGRSTSPTTNNLANGGFLKDVEIVFEAPAK